MWYVLIHILGIRAECACWRAGGPRPPLREPSKSGGGKPPPYVFPPKVLEPGRGALGLPPGTCAREPAGG